MLARETSRPRFQSMSQSGEARNTLAENRYGPFRGPDRPRPGGLHFRGRRRYNSAQMAQTVNTEFKGGVFRITLNRPEAANCIDDSMIEALRQAMDRIRSERRAWAVVLGGAGPAFCAGVDLDWLKETEASEDEESHRPSERLSRLFLELDRLEMPLVGRVQGDARGHGAALVAVCDAAIASATARFSLSDAGRGAVPAVIAPFVVRKIGPGRSRDLFLSGREIGGEEAAAMGLVSRSVDPTLLDAAVEKVLGDIRAGDPQALADSKRLLQAIQERPRAEDDLIRRSSAPLPSSRSGE